MDNQTVLNRLNAQFPAQIQHPTEPYGLLTFEVEKDCIMDVLAFVKTDPELQFSYLTDITAVHYPKKELPFAVVYHVHNLVENIRLRIKVYIGGEVPTIATATSLWNGANWMEREAFDFYGVVFEGHPDLRRILNVDDMDVFPMRKEYPLEDPNRVDKKDYYFGR